MEREIIELFMRHLKLQGDLPLGDDAGAIKWKNEWLVVTNDMLVRTTDVPDIMTPEQVGFKVFTMNVSDVAAMGATPIGFLFSIGVPRDFERDYLEGISRGIARASEFYRTPIISADTNEACDLIIDGIAVGKTKRLLTRSGAKIGDLVCVTGDIGRALAGLKVYFRNLKIGERTRKVLYEKLLEPKARIKEGQVLSKYANAAIDISDGMSKELHLIAEMSKVKIIINAEKLPIREEVFEVAELLGLDPIEVALASGEEFELIFTIPEEHLDQLDFDFAVIGRVEKGEGVYLRRNGKLEKMPVLGWEHLSKF
ncbi:thiamine-phosphate kinase [Thermococcus sibiricus]|uniref:Thiamine-monophosphate kinase n=2 Tax=Thermococcus sibiricus TaxID=172049 RepID=C6A204_THESM|nr:thiamine-phosphate kinase [Thermococcus sibiricus]ACS89649.1 Thiamine monophosphate kinase [Thermococcus sibiricus MM 739]KUK17304.1 MAG: Thiamine-monophosphate kinase [Thermococcus sibiricus]